MTNYIHLTLDTTAPKVGIFAPAFAIRSSRTPITIEADEPIISEELYLIDAENNRHNLVFDSRGNRLEGELHFNTIPLGTATLYVIVKDSVDNTSELHSKSLTIIESEILTSVMEMTTTESIMELATPENIIQSAIRNNEIEWRGLNNQLELDQMSNRMVVEI